MKAKKFMSKVMLFVWGINTLSVPLSYAADPAFDAGKNMGQSFVNQNKTPSDNSLAKVPGYSDHSSSDYSGVGASVYKSGSTTPVELGNMYDAGNAVKADSQNCDPSDNSCKARNLTSKKYSIGSPPNPYLSDARAMKAGVNPDPLSVLGINTPSQNGGQSCVNTTATLPATTERRSCLDSQFTSLHVLTKIPTTEGTTYTSPACLDPSYILSGDLSTCSKTTYSCPSGGSLNGTICEMNVTPQLVEKKIPCEGTKTVFSNILSGSINLHNVASVVASCSPGGDSVKFYINSSKQPNYSFTVSLNGGSKDTAYIPAPYSGGGFPFLYSFLGVFCNANTHLCDLQLYTFFSRDGSGTFSGFKVRYKDYLRHHGWNYTLRRNTFQGSISSTKYKCPSKYDLVNGMCTKKYLATATTQTATPGCLGGAIYNEQGNPVQSSPTLIDGNQSGGTKTCASTTYSCPAGMSQNGYLCEDPDIAQYKSNPRCVNLGYKENSDMEGYYCTEQQLDECSDLPNDCTEVEKHCVYTDEVLGSPTQGQCLAYEKFYDCPVPEKTVTTQNCSYDPVCMNGNCFGPKEDKCTGLMKTVTKTRIESCFASRPQSINTCTIESYYDLGELKYRLSSDCDIYKNDASCIQFPVVQNENGTWPDQAAFSCLGDEEVDCDKIMNDPNCDTTQHNENCVQYEDLSASNSTGTIVNSPTSGRCLMMQRDYTCTDSYQAPDDECTRDLSEVLLNMELGREAGDYLQSSGDINNLKVFKGEQNRCDRRSATFAGGGFGSKSCCNTSPPQKAMSNKDVMASQVANNAIALVEYGVQKPSAYVYDYIMNSETYSDAAMKLWENGVLSDDQAVSALDGAGTSSTWDSVSFTPSVSYAGFSISYAGSAAATTATYGGATATSTVPLGGGFQFQFSPVGFYIYAALQLYSMYTQSLACDEEDYKTAVKSDANLCYTTYSKCVQKNSGLFGSTCEKYRTYKCCFNSRLAKLINQQGKAQLGITGEDDACDGFTPDQFGQLDWSKIDLTPFVSELLTGANNGIPQQSDIEALQQKMMNKVTPQGVTKTSNYTP